MTTLKEDQISAVDLSEVILLNNYKKTKAKSVLSDNDLQYQEQRRKRKVRKIDFETR